MPTSREYGAPRRIRIPLLLDVVLVDHLAQITELDANPDLTRVVQHDGPFVNRLLSRRIARAFMIGAQPLPTFVDRADPLRARRQSELETRLTGHVDGGDASELAVMTRYVQGRGDRESAGVAAQTTFGRLFDPSFRATPETYRAACLVRDFPRAMPPRSWWWRLSGKLSRGQKLLGGVAGGEPAAVHAVTNTVHNVVETLDRMRTQAAGTSPNVTATEAVDRCLAAPPALIRWCTRATHAAGLAKPLQRGTLVMLRLDRAHDELGDAASPFLVGAWNQCPAHHYVRALLERVWNDVRQS